MIPKLFFNSTARPLFDRVMAEKGCTFDTTGLLDLEGDNSLMLMSEFVC